MSSEEPPWVEASYEGTCKMCGKRIHLGDWIRAIYNGPGWRCWTCGQQQHTRPRRSYNPLDSIG